MNLTGQLIWRHARLPQTHIAPERGAGPGATTSPRYRYARAVPLDALSQPRTQDGLVPSGACLWKLEGFQTARQPSNRLGHIGTEKVHYKIDNRHIFAVTGAAEALQTICRLLDPDGRRTIFVFVQLWVPAVEFTLRCFASKGVRNVSDFQMAIDPVGVWYPIRRGDVRDGVLRFNHRTELRRAFRCFAERFGFFLEMQKGRSPVGTPSFWTG
jgi:hypothetical protein